MLHSQFQINRGRALPLLTPALLLLTPVAQLQAQGKLTPPGAPAPTMKTLDQVEPRTDLQAVTLPPGVTTDVSYHYIINQPGSYYLSANLDVSKPNGIHINAEAVTLDLNGFEIARASGSSGNGIEIAAASHRASVRNGSIKGFAYGVRSIRSGSIAHSCSFSDLVVSECTNTGIFAGEGSALQACRAHDNSGSGIYADFGSSVTNCSAHNNTGFDAISTNAGSALTNCAVYNNTGTYGILANGGSLLTNCTAFLNTVTYGIFVNVSSSLTNCTAYSNTSSSTTSAGIRASSGSTITHCTANFNISTAATSTPTSGMGFYVGSGSTIQGCTAYSNQGDGINVVSDTVVRNNTCDSNGSDGDGAGIHATSSDNRIEGNNVTGNDRGIDMGGSGSFIIKNSASGNLSNYEIVSNNKVGIIVSAPNSGAISGSSGGVGVGSTDPWANFSY